MNNAPERYEILPAPVERVIEVASRLGRFIFSFPGEYKDTRPHGAAEMLDTQLYEQGRLEI